MNTSTRRLALKSAAKVAFGSLLLHCGGVVAQGPADAQAEANLPPDAGSLDVSAPDSGLVCAPATEVDAGDVTEEAFQCCVAHVASQAGDASPWGPNGPDASVVADDPSSANCCRAIVARLDHEPDGGVVSDDYTTASAVLPWCCAVAFDQGPACSPWGPPMPPPLDLASAREVA